MNKIAIVTGASQGIGRGIALKLAKEGYDTPLLLIPRKPTLNNYINLLRDKRISIGYLTSLKILLLGLPIKTYHQGREA